MMFFKSILFDLKQGILNNKILWISPLLIIGLCYVYFTLVAVNAGIPNSEITYGDFWICIYGGMKPYIPSPGNAFRFPIIWIMWLVTGCFAALNYPFRDLYGIGQQILVRSQGRKRWWLSKCLWNVMIMMIYNFVIIFFGVILCKLTKINSVMGLNLSLMKTIFNIERNEAIISHHYIPVMIVLLPILVATAINLLQMMLSLFFRPLFSFLFIMILLSASAYLFLPFAIGNYAMPLRYKWMLEGGVSVSSGYIISIVMMIFSTIVGGIRFLFLDILVRE